jgi:hypothetical protein
MDNHVSQNNNTWFQSYIMLNTSYKGGGMIAP